MLLAVQIDTSKRVDEWVEEHTHALIQVTYRDGMGKTRKQLGGLISNDEDKMLLAVDYHRPVFSWKSTGRNSIICVHVYDLCGVADLLQKIYLLVENEIYYSPPWEN